MRSCDEAVAQMNELSTHTLVSLRRGALPLHRATYADNTTVLIAGYGAGDATPAVLACLQYEYAFRASLEAAWAVLPTELSSYGDELVLVLDDPGGRPLDDWCARPIEVGVFLSLAISIATAVRDMHAHSVIHRDLCPNNILVDIQSDQWVARLTGFGFASHAQQSSTASSRRDWISGSFAYMAPELGGRMNVSVDARADLYSLGCIFYLLLTGAPPFECSDATSWVHAHATRHPAALVDRVPDLPEQISLLVLKLLEKAPEDRYQNAGSLLCDLKRCANMWRLDAHINHFPLGTDDIIVRLTRAVQLSGRDSEVGRLLASFDRVAASGQAEFVLVSGSSGIGKSTLIREGINRMLQRAAPLVAACKGDEGRQAVPYSSLSQMLEELMRPILGYAENEFLMWRERIAGAVGSTGALLHPVIPTLSAILGNFAPTPELSPHVERDRFLQAAARVIGAFAMPAHPLVLFFDDLQWADASTLAVLQCVFADQCDRPLLVIGAIRGNEVADDHPVRHGFGADSRKVSHLGLMPLDLSSVRQLLGNVLQCDSAHVGALADLVKQKTDGNPLFVTQFTMALAHEGLLEFRHESRSWAWDLERIRARGYTDNAVDLLLLKLDLLPAGTRTLLRYLSCLGDRASVATLGAASGIAEDILQGGLGVAVEANCVYEEKGAYVFWHDRIREAAYASMPDADRRAMHLEIGRRLSIALDCEHGSSEELFEAVTQINRAQELVTSRQERKRFALLNLSAGQHAKAATAYHAALSYFSAAANLLDKHTAGESARMAQFLCGECEFMTGSLAAAETRLAALEHTANDVVFAANLARLRASLYTVLNRPDLALTVGLDFLRKCGVTIPTRPTNAEVDREFERLNQRIAGRNIEALGALPVAQDVIWPSVMKVFADLVPPALFTDANLVDFLLIRMTNLSLEHGHCNASCYGYVHMALVFGERYGDYVKSHAFGELALYLVDERNLSGYRSRVYMCFGTLVLPWTRSIRLSHQFIREAYTAAVESGDLSFAVYCGRNLVSNLIFAGAPLSDVWIEAEKALGIARAAKFTLVVNALLSQLTLIRRLQGRRNALEESHEDMVMPRDDMPQTLVDFSYWVYQSRACFTFGDLTGALEAQRRAAASLSSARSFIETADFHYYGALAHVAACYDPQRKAASWSALETHLAHLSIWAGSSPENFAGRLALVSAEIARLEGRILDAEMHYKEALDHARKHDLTQNEGLASELAANFYDARGNDIIARAYFRHARQAYLRWGAHGKVDQIEQRYPYLLEPTTHRSREIDRFQQLDVNAVVRVSNALGSEIVLARLVETVMRAALGNASAQSGVLAILMNGEWKIQAQATVDANALTVTQSPGALSPDTLPVALVLTVARTMECMVLDDARTVGAFAQDAYIQRYQPRSVLCLPLIKQSVLVGLLYLENNLAAGVFTPDKATVLEVLASQAAIALENARLYEDLIDQNRQRARAEEALRSAQGELARVGRLTAMGELLASIVHEVAQPISAVDTSVGAALRWLDRAEPNVDEVRLMLNHIASSVKRTKSIIQGLRGMAQKAEPQFAVFDINAAIREVIALLRAQIGKYQAVLEQRGVEVECLVHGDRVQIQQVVFNLLMNGMEAMATVTTHVRAMTVISMLDDAGMVQVTVEDAGTGIALNAVGKIFEPFFTTKASGMGMGLSICRSIVEAHGGTLNATLRQPQGSAFRFTVAQASQ